MWLEPRDGGRVMEVRGQKEPGHSGKAFLSCLVFILREDEILNGLK